LENVKGVGSYDDALREKEKWTETEINLTKHALQVHAWSEPCRS
jgi:hypothetical protein